MTCHDFEHAWNRRLDGDAPATDAVSEHLSVCPRCRARGDAARRLEAGIRLLTPPTPPADLAARVLRRVRKDRLPLWRRRPVLTGLAMAASLLLVVAVVRKPRPVEVTVAPVPPPEPTLNDGVAGAASAVASLTRRAADETVEGGRLLLPAPSPPSPPTGAPLAEAFEPPAESLREAGQGVTSGLRPVTASARRAVSLFLRDLSATGPNTLLRF